MKLHHRLCILAYIHLCSQSKLTLRMRLTGVDSSLTTWQLNFSSSQHNFLILLMVREMIPIHSGVSILLKIHWKTPCVVGFILLMVLAMIPIQNEVSILLKIHCGFHLLMVLEMVPIHDGVSILLKIHWKSLWVVDFISFKARWPLAVQSKLVKVS